MKPESDRREPHAGLDGGERVVPLEREVEQLALRVVGERQVAACCAGVDEVLQDGLDFLGEIALFRQCEAEAKLADGLRPGAVVEVGVCFLEQCVEACVVLRGGGPDRQSETAKAGKYSNVVDHWGKNSISRA